MRGQLNSFNFFLLFAALLLSAGCTSSRESSSRRSSTHGIPEVLNAKGVLKIDVVYPEDGATRPSVDSNFIFGSVGSGSASLWINGFAVPVEKNGAFLTFLPMPRYGYAVVAKDSALVDSAFVSFGAKEGGSQSDAGSIGVRRRPTAIVPLHHPTLATIITGRDTLETGSDVTPASAEPGADRKWQWPRGTRILVTDKSGTEYRVALSKSEDAWVADSSVRLDDQSEREIAIPHPRIQPEPAYEDVIIGAQWGAFLIEAEPDQLVVTLYHRSLEQEGKPIHPDALVAGISTRANATNVISTIRLTSSLWGYKAFFTSKGELVVRIRRAPHLEPDEPLRGLRVMIDPGHPPGGAIGPTRLTEMEANLAIGLRVRDKLLARGAIVEMTRTTNSGMKSSTVQSTELWARVDSAVRGDAYLLVSIHNNGFPDGVNPFANYGTSTYYFDDFSESLAASLEREIQLITEIPNQGAHKRSLAMVRPTWMPSVLTESLYMMFPEQEAALRDPTFLDRLAEAHVRGIEEFLRSKISGP